TIIGWPAPNKQGTGAAHGAKLGAEEVAGVKKFLGFDPDKHFDVDPEVIEHTREVMARGAAAHVEWDKKFAAWQEANPERAQLLQRLRSGELPQGWADSLPTFEAGSEMATRKASGQVLNALAPVLPELWGGSADLAASNNTPMGGAPACFREGCSAVDVVGAPCGRSLHFGMRELAMGAIVNGIALEGTARVYGGSFLSFSDCRRPALRIGALTQAPSIIVWTHDSI